jgi:hypothetical protein
LRLGQKILGAQGVAMTSPPQEQRNALHALGIDDEVIQLLTPEDREKVIRYLTPERVQELFRTPPTRDPQQEQPPQARETTNDGNQPPAGHDHNANVVHLAERAQEVLEITELEPKNRMFVGKRINPDGSITSYSLVKLWRQRVVRVPATISHLFAYHREARKRNVILIRGAPANPTRQPTQRQKAFVDGRGDHGFIDTPTRLIVFDIDGAPISWCGDPERAVRAIVEQLGEAWAKASFMWSLSSTCGLERDAQDRWTGRIIDGHLRAHIKFLADRALIEREVIALAKIAKVRVPELDPTPLYHTNPNYITRPLWVEHPGRDVLGDIPTIGWVKGKHEYLAVPDDLAHTARWAQAQGVSSDMADHPDAETAVRSIGCDNDVRPHVKAVVWHLLIANPPSDVVSFDDHSINIIAKLKAMIAQHREEIVGNLIRNGRDEHEIDNLLEHVNTRWALWLLNHSNVLKYKTIKLVKQQRTQADTPMTREAIFARVKRAIEHAYSKAVANQILERAPPQLVVAPTGSRKSTLLRAAAVLYIKEKPKKTVVILVPRHKLGDEQIDLLRKEHPAGNYTAAVWRGRHADNPNDPDPEHPGKFLPMCRREKDATAVEKALLDVESSLCKRGRGDKTIKCPFYDGCAYQQQKRVKANIWFAAHEWAVHEMPKAFGDVGWVIFDESPLDAFMFGVDLNDQVTLELDTLRTPLPIDPDKLGGYWVGDNYGRLIQAREGLYYALGGLRVPIEWHQGVAVPRENLKLFIDPLPDSEDSSPKELRTWTWRGKIEPDIWPDMSREQLEIKLSEAAINATIKKEVTLWELIDAVGQHEIYGRIQVHRGTEGRHIHMMGLRRLAKGWDAPTLICDATGDAELLKPIWPQLEEAALHGWEQLPRPTNVRVFQCVNRTISKWAVAVEGKHQEERERKIEGARRLYAAVMMKALEYGGADVGVIVYKTTRDWIEKNCFVPEWLKLVHWGDVTGTNTLQHARALFVIGRPLASAEDVTRQAEALFGAHIPQRDYVTRCKQGRIPIVPDAVGNNCILVDVQAHPDPMAERLRRQITEGSIIQAVGRARAGLREANEPLDIHLWSDVPAPELGPVEPVLWSELEAGPDGLMLATEGGWLRNTADAVRAFKGLFAAGGLRDARARQRQTEPGGGDAMLHLRGLAGLHIGIPIYGPATPALMRVVYQRAAAGCKPTAAMFLRGVSDPRGWLEEKLGRLAWFEVVGWEDRDLGAAEG